MHPAEHPDRGVAQIGVGQPRQGEGVGRARDRLVVNDDLAAGDVGGVRDLEPETTRLAHDALLPRPAERDRLTVLQTDQHRVAAGRVLQHVERTVVEDGTVLVDLDEGATLVRGGGTQHRVQVLAVGVDGTGHERRLRAERERDRVERGVAGADRRRLGDLAELRRGRALPLGQPVDPVVEHQDLEVDVTAECVDEVVAADRQRVTVTADDPYRQVWTADRETRRDRRCPAVDRVHAVGVEVVREPGRTADPGDERDPLTRDAQLRHERLDGRQDREVTASRAPADLLIRPEVLGGEFDGHFSHYARPPRELSPARPR